MVVPAFQVRQQQNKISSGDRTVETKNARTYVYFKDVIVYLYNTETKSTELC